MVEQTNWDPRLIAREARREAELHPPTFQKGDRATWVVRGYAGLTDGLSEIHRVYDAATTYCELDLPQHAPAFLPPLSSLDPCATCAERRASGWERPAPEETLAPVIQARSVA
jgi:hypothetical protein